MTKFFYIGLFFLPLIILFGCSDDEMQQIQSDLTCEDISDLGEILLLEESKNFLPYPTDISRVIFTNSQGAEFEGTITYYNTYLANSEFIMQPCPIDTVIQIQYTWKSEVRDIIIQIDALDICLRGIVSPSLHTQDLRQKLVLDRFRITLHTQGDSLSRKAQIYMVVNERTHPNPGANPGDDYLEFHDEFQIHGKVFENVFAATASTDEEFDLYYNAVVGFVGFKGQIDSNYIDLKFDRIE